MLEDLKRKLDENGDIRLAKNAFNDYKWHRAKESYKQASVPVPWPFKIASLIFFVIALFGVVHEAPQLIGESPVRIFISLLLPLFFFVLFFVGWLLVPLANIIIRINPNKVKHIAVVTDIVDSAVAHINGVPCKSLMLKVEDTGEQLIYETNGKKIKYNIGDRIDIVISNGMWSIK